MAASITDQDGTVPHIHRQRFSLPQLPTSSVTIYPARATVVRNIKGIVLKPGRNEIILHQLTPRADENSIKVSGRLIGGSILLIADMTVDLVKPPAPSGAGAGDGKDKVVSWEPDSDNDGDEEEATVSDNDTPTLKDLSEKVQGLKSKIKVRREDIASCEKQLAYLERWGTTLTDKDLSEGLAGRSTADIRGFLSVYSEKRAELMAQRATCAAEVEIWENDLNKFKKEKEKLSARILRKKVKAREERLRKKEEERERLREEGKEDKDTKAPEKWYRVRVWIDREENDDREGSSKVASDVEGELELKYTVSDAGWASRYDIVISSAGGTESAADTTNPKSGKVTAHLTYHAHFQNRTYETWKDALITLSTSQTVFTGLADGAPTLEPWRVRLVSVAGHYGNKYGHGYADGGDSATAMLKNRTQGGLYSSQEKAGIDKEKKEERKIVQPMQNQYRRGPVKSKRKKSALSLSKGASSAPSASFKMDSMHIMEGGGGRFFAKEASDEGDDNDNDDGESSESEDEAASMAETLTRTLTLSSIHQPAQPPAPKPNFITQGLTSSYSLPHRMTLPSTHGSSGDLETSTSAVRRHTILTMPLNQIQLSYACTPKLRAAAYLKARILNDSSTTLRKGLVGVTLDGTFVGSTPLPRTVYPGGIFNLPLGIDESVTVTYAKPSIKRNAQKSATGGGLFSGSMISWGKGQQEMVATYGRSTVIRNNRLDRGAIELVVCDQVPVSEDAKLVVTVTYPRGLKPPPPLLTPGTKNAKAIQEEPETGEGDEGGEEGSSMRMGQPVKTGTGVYVEGFSAAIAQEETPEPATTQLTTPQNLQVPPVSTSTPSDDDSASYQETVKSKRKSLFSIGKSSTVKSSSTPQTPAQPQFQPQPKKQELQPFWKPTNAKEEKWGSAVAAMRRNGEVVWKVKLNPGMGVRLGLEYDAKVPAGEGIAGL